MKSNTHFKNIRYCNECKQTGTKIEVVIWNEELKLGYPIVTISIDNDMFEVTLQDIIGLYMSCGALIDKAPFFIELKTEYDRQKLEEEWKRTVRIITDH